MSRNVIPSDGRHNQKELNADLTIPAGAAFVELQSKINALTDGGGLRIDGSDEIVVRAAVVGTMPAGSEVVIQPILHGFPALTPITLVLGGVTDGVVTDRIADNDTLRDADLLKVTYEFKQGGADYDVTFLNLQVKKKDSIDPVIPRDTTQDETIYVDPVSGSDDSGTGSVLQPYKSLRFLNDLPDTILNEIRVNLKAGSYDYFPEVFERKYFGDGRIILDASGETYPITAGPFTIQTVTGIGDQYFGYETAYDILVTGSPGWTPDEYYPKFIHMTSGNWDGYILPIWKNTTDTIRTFADWYGLAPGDTFNIVDCPAVFDIPEGISLRGNISGLFDFTGVVDREAPLTPFFLMAGVKIRMNGTKQKRSPFKIEEMSAVFSFCAFINDDNVSSEFDKNVVGLTQSALNSQILAADTFANQKLSDWYGYACHISQKEGDPRDNINPDIELSDCSVALICVRGGIWAIEKPSYRGGGFVAYCMAGGVHNNLNTFFDAGPVFVEQIGYNDTAVLNQGVGSLTVRAIYIQKSGIPCENWRGGLILAEWFKGNTPGITAAYALKQWNISRFIRNSVTDVNILGSTGAIEFPFNSGTHATWPASGSAVDDTGGSIVITN